MPVRKYTNLCNADLLQHIADVAVDIAEACNPHEESRLKDLMRDLKAEALCRMKPGAGIVKI